MRKRRAGEIAQSIQNTQIGSPARFKTKCHPPETRRARAATCTRSLARFSCMAVRMCPYVGQTCHERVIAFARPGTVHGTGLNVDSDAARNEIPD